MPESPPNPTDPLLPWRQLIDKAKAFAELFELEKAIKLLTNGLIDHRAHATPDAHLLAAISHGLLGHIHFSRGSVPSAIPHFEQALALAEQLADGLRIVAHTHDLYESNRYVGNPAAAADWVDRNAAAHDAMGHPDSARRSRTLARIARAGEPLLRAAVALNGQQYEIDEAPPIPPDTHIQFLQLRNRPTIPLAESIKARGNELIQQSQFDQALSAYAQASRIDPHDPDPRHKSGLTLMIMKRYPEALQEFQTTDTLAPSWLQVRSDIHHANRLIAGILDHLAYLRICLIESTKDTQKAMKLADDLVKESPALPEGHHLRAITLASLGQTDDAVKSFREALELDPDPDLRSRILVNLAARTDDSADRMDTLVAAAALTNQGGNLIACASATILLRRAESRRTEGPVE